MELWKYKYYILYSVRAKLMTETINNHLGLLWLIFEPVLRMTVYYVVFVYLIQRRTEDFTSFLLVGIMGFTWFSKTVVQSGNSIKSAGGLICQRYLPKMIFPTITSLVRAVDFLMVLGILMFYFALKGLICPPWLALPCVILSQFLLTYGVSMAAAAIIPFIPDVSILMNSAITALFFLSGVFFEILPSNPSYNLFMLNPIAKLIEQYRVILLHGKWPDWLALGKIGIMGGIGIFLTALFIKKMDCYYPRLVK